jgi:hypothetical protein
MKAIRGILTVMLMFSLTVAFGFTIPDVAKTKNSFVIEKQDVKTSSVAMTFELKNVIFTRCIEHRICSNEDVGLDTTLGFFLPAEKPSFMIKEHQSAPLHSHRRKEISYTLLNQKIPVFHLGLPMKVGWRK